MQLLRSILHLHYAYYYALLCLLHHQLPQAAHSFTIIIDGATTNEWNTRDDYLRLIGAPQPAAADDVAADGDLGSPAGGVGGNGANTNDLVPVVMPVVSDTGSAGFGAPSQSARVEPRTSNDDVAELVEAAMSVYNSNHRRARGSAPQHFCGDFLIRTLDLVCDGQFAEVSEPIITKARRSLDPLGAATGVVVGLEGLAAHHNQKQHQYDQQHESGVNLPRLSRSRRNGDPKNNQNRNNQANNQNYLSSPTSSSSSSSSSSTSSASSPSLWLASAAKTSTSSSDENENGDLNHSYKRHEKLSSLSANQISASSLLSSPVARHELQLQQQDSDFNLNNNNNQQMSDDNVIIINSGIGNHNNHHNVKSRRQYSDDQLEDRSAYLKMSTRSSRNPRIRLIRGVTQDCCKNACTMAEMRQYCKRQ